MASLNLKYNEYSTNLNNSLHQLLETTQNADVTFAVDGRFIKAHQIILSMFSPYFQELFAANPCPHPIFFMKDVSYNVMKDILRFIYAGEVQIAQKDVSCFVETANALKVKGLAQTQEQTGVLDLQTQKRLENDQIEDIITLSSSQLDQTHDSHTEEEINRTQGDDDPKEDLLDGLKYLKYEPHDSSMDIEESQMQLSYNNEHDLTISNNLPCTHVKKLLKKEVAKENNEELVAVKFVENGRGKAIIVNDMRYFKEYVARSKNPNHWRFACSKSKSKKCRAEVLLRGGYIMLQHQHLPLCSRRRYTYNDTILKEKVYIRRDDLLNSTL